MNLIYSPEDDKQALYEDKQQEHVFSYRRSEYLLVMREESKVFYKHTILEE